MAITIQHSHNNWMAQIEHRTGETPRAGIDGTGVRTLDLDIKGKARLIRATNQPLASAGQSGEFHCFYKIQKPYGTWRSIAATVGEALSAGELTSVSLSGEGVAARDGISVGSILRITGIVAADTPDSTVVMVVRVTAVTLTAGSADQIDFEHIWTSVSRACDTAATLELYDRNVKSTAHYSEDIWQDLNTTIDEADDGSETALTLASEGIAATKGIVPGSFLKLVGVLTAVANYEIVLVTSITLAGGQPDVINVVRGQWETAAIGRDTAATIFMLNGRITDLKSLNSVADNTRYEPTTYDDDYMDFDENSALRSVYVDPSTVDGDIRCNIFFAGRVA